MAPSAAPYSAMARALARVSGKRHGRQTQSRISAENPTRNAVVPWAPRTPNRLLANDVPTQSEAMEAMRASTASSV
ncbi:hypothetical protein D3C86_1869800 [compost metagenome]